ncbi:Modifier of mdg4 [Operophtera brumata]|uniref:Modifier of mdg4 n=1 Tax=Operophtera brumata TaxID=104452 RepID=A0A0L7L7A6_OPEBR|nr:Modifier of mdg4 [Operophtera brumata]
MATDTTKTTKVFSPDCTGRVPDVILHLSVSFGVTRFGKPVLILNGHRFSRNNGSVFPRAHWMCTKRFTSSKCKASVSTFNDKIVKPIFTTTKYGNPIMLLGGYRYTKNNRSRGLKALWTCYKRVTATTKIYIQPIREASNTERDIPFQQEQPDERPEEALDLLPRQDRM